MNNKKQNYLFIDTSIVGQINLAIFSYDKLVTKSQSRLENKYSEKLLTLIDKLLKSKNIKIKDLSGIFVVSGPGRFSALRTGVNTANTLAWVLGIPVIGINGENGQGGEIGERGYWREKMRLLKIETDRIKMKKFNEIVVPAYGQEPNISKPK